MVQTTESDVTSGSATDSRSSPPPEWTSWPWFIRRVLALVGIVFLAYLLWQVREAFLLAFAAVIVATLLLAATEPVERHTPLSHCWALTVAGLTILAGVALALYLMGTQVRSQIDELANLLPQALRYVEQQLGVAVPGFGSTGQGGSGFSLSGDLANRLASWSYAAVDVLASLILVIAGGVFFAADPGCYRRGLVLLFPKSQHARADDALRASGQALRLWLLAELIAMGIIGVLAGLGTWLIGLPAPPALFLFAVFALWLLFGALGVIIGAPLTVVLYVLVKKLYLRQTLGAPTKLPVD